MKIFIKLLLSITLSGCATTKLPNGGQMGKEVSFKSAKDGARLNGTYVSVHKSKGTVLFIVGSGKTDRDETADETMTFSGKKEKLFRQLAVAFADAGYSSLRYDKRGVLNDSGKVDKELWVTADREHLISDAVDAARFLQSEFKVESKDLIILGHSEGTIIGVEAAIAINEQLRGLVLLGAQARSMKDMLYYQIVESPHASTAGLGQKPIEDYKMALKMIEESKEIWAPDNKPMSWYKQFFAAPANQDRIHLVKAPIAIFQGEEDFSTPIAETERFRSLGLNNLRIKTYPGLGHCFSPNRDKVPTYGPIDAKVIIDILETVESF
jgi:pimeloyl-ACP methyl ester carboxylesterase